MYLRKSRAEEQASTEEVLAKHKEALVTLAVRKGIIVTDIFEEVISGESLSARPEMLKLLKGVQAGDYDAVLCMDIDRLGRGGMADQGVILDAFRYSDTLIVTPDKTYDLSDESDEELTEFKAFMARREYKIIRKRMRRGLMQTVEKGGYVANPPYGYAKCTVNKMPSLEIVDEEAHFVRFIFSQYINGVGTHRIAAALNEMGSVPRRNAEWSRSTINRLLQNPTYTGKVAWNRVKHYRPGTHGNEQGHVKYIPKDQWQIYEGLHPAIISDEEYQRVQEILHGRFIPSKKTGHTTNPLAGLIICSKCGRHMQQFSSNNLHVPYINCVTTDCQAAAKTEYVEAYMLSSLEDMLKKLQLSQDAVPLEEVNTYLDMLAGAEKDLEKLNARIPRLYDFLEDGTYDRDTFRVRMEAAEKERAALIERQHDINSEIEKIQTRDMRKTANQLQTVLALYPTLDVEGKNMLLKTVVEKIEYTKAKKTKPRDFTLEITLRHF